MKKSRFTEDGMDASLVYLTTMEVQLQGDHRARHHRTGHCQAILSIALC